MNVARDRDPPSAWAARPGLAVTRVIVSAYLALTIGMTFQVSDTDLMVKRVRRVALRHALLSYLYGTVIVAITVSTVASLLGQRT